MKSAFITMAVAAGIAAAVSCSRPGKKLASYWNGHDFSSTETFKDIKAAEDTFEGFIDLLVHSPYEVSVPVLNEFLDSAAGNPVAYTLWSGWFEPYLHLLESPYRNDSLFTVWLDRTIADKVLDDYMMEHLLDMRKVNGQNRPGMPASDVLLRDATGMEFRLSELKGEKIMLCLLDANCPSCIQTMNTVAGSAGAAGMRLVSVLVYGNETVLGRVAASVSPEWTVTYCPGREIEDWECFDLSLLPYCIVVGENGLVEDIRPFA